MLFDARLASGFVVEELDLLEETGLVVLIKLWAEFLRGGGELSHGN